jgi:hypothetical protein
MRFAFLLATLALNILTQDIDETLPSGTAHDAGKVDQILYSCVLLSRYQLSFYGPQLLEVVKQQESYEDKSQVWKKMYTGHVRHCQARLTYDESGEVPFTSNSLSSSTTCLTTSSS